MNIISRLFVFTSIMFVVVACGGGGSTSSSNKGTGYLVDSAVDGASYVCSPSGKSGVTGTDGQYQCTAGDTVVFSLGDIKLPSIPAQSFVTVLDLAGVAKTTDTRAVNIAVLIQSLDDDGDITTSINITAARVKALTGLTNPNINFDSTSFATELAEVVSKTGITLVSEADAIAHVEQVLAKLPSDPDDAPGILAEATITVDGSNADWTGIVPVHVNKKGNHIGNSSTDLISLRAATSGTKMVLLMQTDGPIAMPHTPSQRFSSYSVGVYFFSDANCKTEIGSAIANNVTDSKYGSNTHSLDFYVQPYDTSVTTTAFNTNYLETSFSKSDILSGTKSMRFHPFITSIDIQEGGVTTNHDTDSNGTRKCFSFTP